MKWTRRNLLCGFAAALFSGRPLRSLLSLDRSPLPDPGGHVVVSKGIVIMVGDEPAVLLPSLQFPMFVPVGKLSIPYMDRNLLGHCGEIVFDTINLEDCAPHKDYEMYTPMQCVSDPAELWRLADHPGAELICSIEDIGLIEISRGYTRHTLYTVHESPVWLADES